MNSVQTKSARILVVDDDPVLRQNVQMWLSYETHVVETASDGESALEKLAEHEYDIIILDWQMPKMSGIELLSQYRANGGMALVLMLTGKSTVDDTELGLNNGADDYLTKPFHVKELSMRVKALLRRPSRYAGDKLCVGPLVVDTIARNVQLSGRAVQLSPHEFDILVFLLKHPNETFSAEDMLDRLWVSSSDATAGAIRTHIKNLRKKLDQDGNASLIRNIHSVGYRLEYPAA